MSLLQSWENCSERAQLPPHLPISHHAEELIEAFQKHDVVVVAGETGSGKTTQVPKLCIKAGLGKKGKILMTQPRRLAAIRTAIRIAEEMELEAGKEIGYRIRFQHRSSPDTLLDVVTDGIPLSGNLKQDPFNNCEVVIVDEVHERSVNIDLILGLLKLKKEQKNDLKIVLMSATLDLERLSDFFPEAKSFSVSGRTHPVHIEYVETDKDSTLPDKVTQQILNQVRNDLKGNLLCFLPTERDIRESEQKLKEQLPQGFECLPLFSRLSQKDQDRVFKSHSENKKIILSTNIAETSLTLPNIKVVVDSGFVRMLRYHPGRGIPLLEVESISQASAQQRSGRAGRTSEGHCIRLYTEEDFESMDEHTIPEIKRQDLAQVILKLIALGLSKPDNFPFVEKPQSKAIAKGIEQLEFLQAIQKDDHGWNITPIGRGMVKLPLSPRLAHLMLRAKRDKLTTPMAVISACLSIQDPRFAPADQLEQARLAHLRWQVPQSDFLGMLKLFEVYHNEKKKRSQNQLRKWCIEHFLDWRRMREWDQLSHELCDLMQGKWKLDFENINEIRFHQLILGSHLDCLLEKDQKKQRAHYHSLGRRDIITHPSSTLSNKIQNWAVCSGFLSTSQLFALNLCSVEPNWILQQAKGMIQIQRGDPYFDEKSQKVVSEERHIFREHLIHINKYKDHFPYDEQTSTEVFIRQGILEGRCNSPLLNNFKELHKQLEAYDAAERSRDIYAHPDRLVYAWFEKLVEPCSRLSDFKKLEKSKQSIELRDVLNESELITCIEDFPLSVQLDKKEHDIHYLFNPTSKLDGASLKLQRQDILHIDQRELEQLVPRYYGERLHQAYQSLPNGFRKEFNEQQFTEEFNRSWEGFPDYTLKEMLKLWLEQLTQNSKAIEKSLREFSSREENYRQAKLCLCDTKGKVLEIIENITQYLNQSETSLLKKIAQRNKAKLEVDFGDLENIDIPTRCQLILKELKNWPEAGRVLAKTPHLETLAWPALIYKHGKWKIIAHQNKDRAQHLTLTHLGLCLGQMSEIELNFDAEEIDQLKDLRQGVHQSLIELKEVSRLSLWSKVRQQDLNDYESLRQRITQQEKKKWEKLSRRWLKWMIECTKLHQQSFSLNPKEPQEFDLQDRITKLTYAGQPQAKELISREIQELEDETQECFMLIRWQQLKGINFEQASLNWKKFKSRSKQLLLESGNQADPLSQKFSMDDYKTLRPSDIEKPLTELQTKIDDLHLLKQKVKDAESWVIRLKSEIDTPKNKIFYKELSSDIEALIDASQIKDLVNYCDEVEQLKQNWEELKVQKFDLLEKQVPVDPERLKHALSISWKSKSN